MYNPLKIEQIKGHLVTFPYLCELTFSLPLVRKYGRRNGSRPHLAVWNSISELVILQETLATRILILMGESITKSCTW